MLPAHGRECARVCSPMHKGMTSHDKVHFERLPAKSQPCYQQHSSRTELITQAIHDWSELPDDFRWNRDYF